MSGLSRRGFSREFKVAAVERVLAGASVRRVAEDLQIGRNHLYLWLRQYEAAGAEGLRPAGRPAKWHPMGATGKAAAGAGDELSEARQRIGDLERKIGQQGLELDFFRRALRQVGGERQPGGEPGGRRSTRSSKR
jgi:transposase